MRHSLAESYTVAVSIYAAHSNINKFNARSSLHKMQDSRDSAAVSSSKGCSHILLKSTGCRLAQFYFSC